MAQFLTGKEEDKQKVSKNISESASDAKRSKIFGRLVSDKQSVSESINVTLQKDYVFDEKVFTQVIQQDKAVCYLSDGKSMQEPSIVHLMPYYKSPVSDKIIFHSTKEKFKKEEPQYIKF